MPEAYFDLQRQIAREQGHGDITITREMKRQLTEAAQADQRKSLENWVEYLGGEDGAYPDWFKYYTWESVIKLGNYDKEKHEFDKRSRGTTAPYPELNREALAYVFDKLNKSRIHGEEAVTDDKLAKLLQSANFGKLYAYAVHEVTPDSEALRQNIKGSWKKYDQTDDPRVARRLSESLQGHGTGWCTAGESTAASQISMGDFYVFYTEDNKDKETVPRVAIRMQDGEVAELRGIEPNQNLEGIMSDVAMEKLRELPGGEEYIKKAEDMKRLTALEKRLAKNPDAELSKDEVKFLYELDHNIEGFGYDDDPRIGELKDRRGKLDHETLKVLAVEHIRDSFETSYEGYNGVSSQINAIRSGVEGTEQIPIHSKEQIEQLFVAKLAEWQASGVLDYVAERVISHNELHTPIMRPNIIVTTAELKQLANNFASGQGFDEAYIFNDLYDAYDESDYAALSGYRQDAGDVTTMLLSNKCSDELGYGTVESQRDRLQQMSQAAPGLNLGSPSVFDGIVLWNTLRAQGDNLSSGDIWNRNAIRQLNIEPKLVRGYLYVPYVYVDDVGRPRLFSSGADGGFRARVSLG